MFHYSIYLRGPAKLWVASIAFILIGILIGGVLPAVLPASNDPAPGAGFALKALFALGSVFFALGLFTFVLMILGRYIELHSPRNLPVYHWWVDFASGLLGALVFAIPATFAYPVILMIPEDANAGKNRGLGLLFSGLGILALLAIVAAAWLMMRNRPRWQVEGDPSEGREA